MKTVIRYEEECLLIYHRQLDAYEISEDDLMGFPYEAYEMMDLEGEAIYELYLDDKSQYPSVREDCWVHQQDILSFLDQHHPKMMEGILLQEETRAFYQRYLAVREGI